MFLVQKNGYQHKIHLGLSPKNTNFLPPSPRRVVKKTDILRIDSIDSIDSK